MKTYILIAILGMLVMLITVDLWKHRDDTAPKAKIIRLTSESSNATIEAVLGPRLAGERPREIVWTDGKGNVVGEEFLTTDKKGFPLPKATQKRILNAMKKQGFLRLEEHCHGLSNNPPPAATFGYCTFEKVPLGLEG